MPDHDVFMRMICDNPADDGPRLVYADWLEEQGEADRAELIRLQIKMSTCRMCHKKDGTPRKDKYAANCGRCVPGVGRERTLLATNWPTWIGGLITMSDGPGGVGFACLNMDPEISPPALEFRRGFVDSIVCNWLFWLAHAAAIRAAQPVTRVRLTTEPSFQIARDDPSGEIVGLGISGRPWRSFDELQPVDQKTGLRALVGGQGDNRHALLWLEWPGIVFELPPHEIGAIVPREVIPPQVVTLSYREITGDLIRPAAPPA